uniref:Deleted in malignant brain tumors 1 protein-like n=1 Tax=Crassostrea virginica TaxID=6565 RepID=A0A8B8D2P3_CRAVI|nr:deleted in malignant brain tumors 1 protein-like [Crassostrea virginica]
MGFWAVCFLIIWMNYISGAMCQCDGNTLTLSVPSYDTVEITYPGDSAEFYGRNLNCKWLLATDPGLVFIIKLVSLVHCGDILRIHDGSSTGDSVLATVCTSSPTANTEPLYVTKSNQMLIYFNTDGTTNSNEEGFTFTILSGKETSYETEACNSNTKTLTATTEKQVLTSPRFPGEYPSNTNCKWKITASSELASLRISLRFLDLNPSCNYFILIDNGQDEQRPCAKEDFEAINLTSDSSFLINFRSNTESPHGKGFLLLYDGVEIKTTTTGELTTTTATATVLPTASWRKPKIDVTFEALAVLAVFSFFVLVVGVAAPTVLYFSTRQAPALSPPPSPQTVGPPALYYQYFPGAVYQKK